MPGSLQPEYRARRKPTCRCARGRLHGPYWYRRWYEGDRQRCAYVPAADLPRVRAASTNGTASTYPSGQSVAP